MVSLSSLLLVWSAPRAASVALSSKVLLLTVMPRCTIKHGQFFLTLGAAESAHDGRGTCVHTCLAGFKGRDNVQTSPAAAVFAPGREKTCGSLSL